MKSLDEEYPSEKEGEGCGHQEFEEADVLAYLKSLDEPPRWEYGEGDNLEPTFRSIDTPQGPQTEMEISIARSPPPPPPPRRREETSNPPENASPQKTTPRPGPKKRVSWGIPLHEEALNIPQSTMICPENETLEELKDQSPPKEISTISPRPDIMKMPDSTERYRATPSHSSTHQVSANHTRIIWIPGETQWTPRNAKSNQCNAT